VEGAAVVVRPAEAIAGVVARWMADAITGAQAKRGRCLLALSGGSTLRAVGALLAAPPLKDAVDWTRVEVYFADERAVAPDDPESNYGAARALLLAPLAVAEGQVHRMEADRADLDAAAAAYERLLPERLDVLLLGMGPDGHTASLFPGQAAAAETTRRVVAVTASPKPPPRRLTITPPVIAAARRVAMMATGSEKAAAVARALEGPYQPPALPAQYARDGAWFLDEAAAAALAGRAR
jgi:6-phosphogluconolactonase